MAFGAVESLFFSLASRSQIVFVGPSSREDLGFSHSFDLILDSYHTKENLSDPMFFQIGGRVSQVQLPLQRTPLDF